MRTIVKFFLVLLVMSGIAQAAPVAEKDYRVLNPPRPTEPGVVEVREFFSYMCPHCSAFRPQMETWLKTAPDKVKLIRVPVIFHESWRLLAQAYYVAEVLNVVDKIHAPLFNAIHLEKRRFKTKDDMVEFFASQGVSEDEVSKAWDSFAVDVKLRQGMQLVKDYLIDSTPTVVIAGKYAVSPNTAGNQEHVIEVIDTLVRQEAGE